MAAEAVSWVGRFIGFIGESIHRFIYFLFIIFLAGAVFGAVVIQFDPLLLLIPALLALLAYYSRVFALIIFFGLIVVLFL